MALNPEQVAAVEAQIATAVEAARQAANAGLQQAVTAAVQGQNALNNEQFQGLITALRRPNKEKVRLGEFSSTSASEWRYFKARILEAKTLNGWTDQEAKQHLKIALTGEAAGYTQDILIGDDPTGDDVDEPKTFRRYIDEVGLRFISHASSRLAVSEYRKRQQKATETITHFHGNLRELFDVAEPTKDPATDTDLIRHFSEGLIDEQVANYVLENDPKTYQEALTLAQHKEGVMAQRRLAVGRQRAMSRINAIESESEGNPRSDFLPPPGNIFAINYPYGSATPSSTDANKRLRNGASFGPPQQNFNSFLGNGYPQNPYFGHDSSQKRRGRGGGKRGNGKPRGGGGGRGRGGNRKNRRPFRRPGKQRINAIDEEKEGVNELSNLMESQTLDAETGQVQGNWAWPRE